MSVGHLECRAVLRSRAAVVVHARGGNVRVPGPFLHFGDVGLVVERTGGGGRAQPMGAFSKPSNADSLHQQINAVAGDCLLKPTGAMVSWLNMVEIEISVLRGQCLDRRIGDRMVLKSRRGSASEARQARASTGSSRRRGRERSWPAPILISPKSSKSLWRGI